MSRDKLQVVAHILWASQSIVKHWELLVWSEHPCLKLRFSVKFGSKTHIAFTLALGIQMHKESLIQNWTVMIATRGSKYVMDIYLSEEQRKEPAQNQSLEI